MSLSLLVGRMLGVAGTCFLVLAIAAAMQQTASACSRMCTDTCFPTTTIVPNTYPIEYECAGGGSCTCSLVTCGCKPDLSNTLCNCR